MEQSKIQVGVRLRPQSEREKSAGLQQSMTAIDNSVTCTAGTFLFDKVFSENSANQDVFDEMCRPIILSFLEGINGTIFAYGQTASGKTHTMMGSSGRDGEPGVIPIALATIFEYINEHSSSRDFILRCSYLEIYNEELTDLLDKRAGKKLTIKEDSQRNLTVQGLTEHSIVDCNEAVKYIWEGQEVRSVAETAMNERSSRSHAIYRLTLESKAVDGDMVKVSVLNLVDLAGNEKAHNTNDPQRFKEGVRINLSLLHLGIVIAKLSDGESGSYIFRDSKLTRILQNSLGGNAKTAVLCTISPFVSEETMNTLKFAGRAMRIENKPKVNELPTSIDAVLRKLAAMEEENRMLRLRLSEEGETPEKQSLLESLQARETEKQDLEQTVAALKKFIYKEPSTAKDKDKALRRQTVGPMTLGTSRSPVEFSASIGVNNLSFRQAKKRRQSFFTPGLLNSSESFACCDEIEEDGESPKVHFNMDRIQYIQESPNSFSDNSSHRGTQTDFVFVGECAQELGTKLTFPTDLVPGVDAGAGVHCSVQTEQDQLVIQWQDKCSELEKENAVLVEECSSLKSTVSGLREDSSATVEQLQQKLLSMENDAESLKNDLKSKMEEMIDTYEQKLLHAEQDKTSYQNEKNALQTECAALKSQLKECIGTHDRKQLQTQQECSELEKENAVLVEECSKLKSTVSGLREDSSATVEQLQQKALDYEEVCLQLKQDYEESLTRRNQLEAECSELEKENAVRVEECSKLKSTVSGLREDSSATVEQLQQKALDYEEVCLQLKQDYEESLTRRNQLEAECSELEKENAVLVEECSKLKSTVSGLREDSSATVEQLQQKALDYEEVCLQLKQDYEESLTRRNQLEAECSELEKENAVLVEECSKLKSTVSGLREDSSATVEQLQQKALDYEEVCLQLKQDYEESLTRRNQLEAELSQFSEAHSLLSTEKQALLSQIEYEQQQHMQILSEAEQQCSELEKENAVRVEECSKLKSTVSGLREDSSATVEQLQQKALDHEQTCLQLKLNYEESLTRRNQLEAELSQLLKAHSLLSTEKQVLLSQIEDEQKRHKRALSEAELQNEFVVNEKEVQLEDAVDMLRQSEESVQALKEQCAALEASCTQFQEQKSILAKELLILKQQTGDVSCLEDQNESLLGKVEELSTLLSQSQTHNEELEMVYSKTATSREKLKEVCATQDQLVIQWQDKCSELEKENAVLLEECSKLKSTVCGLREDSSATVEQLQQKALDYEEVCLQLKQDYKESLTRRNQLEAELSQFSEAHSLLNKEKQALLSQIEYEQQQHMQILSEAEQQCSELEKENAVMVEECSKLKSTVSGLREDSSATVEQLQQKALDYEEVCLQLKQDYEESLTRRNQLEAELSQFSEAHSRLSTEKQALLSQIEDEKQQHKRALSEAEPQCSELEKENAVLLEECSKLKSTVCGLREDSSATVEQLQQKALDYEEVCLQLKQDYEESLTRRNQLEAELSQFSEAHNLLSTEKQVLLSQIEYEQQQHMQILSEAEQQCSELEKENAVMVEECSKLKSTVSGLREDSSATVEQLQQKALDYEEVCLQPKQDYEESLTRRNQLEAELSQFSEAHNLLSTEKQVLLSQIEYEQQQHMQILSEAEQQCSELEKENAVLVEECSKLKSTVSGLREDSSATVEQLQQKTLDYEEICLQLKQDYEESLTRRNQLEAELSQLSEAHSLCSTEKQVLLSQIEDEQLQHKQTLSEAELQLSVSLAKIEELGVESATSQQSNQDLKVNLTEVDQQKVKLEQDKTSCSQDLDDLASHLQELKEQKSKLQADLRAIFKQVSTIQKRRYTRSDESDLSSENEEDSGLKEPANLKAAILAKVDDQEKMLRHFRRDRNEMQKHTIFYNKELDDMDDKLEKQAAIVKSVNKSLSVANEQVKQLTDKNLHLKKELTSASIQQQPCKPNDHDQGKTQELRKLQEKLRRAAADKKISESQSEAFRQKLSGLEGTVVELQEKLKKEAVSESQRDAFRQKLSNSEGAVVELKKKLKKEAAEKEISESQRDASKQKLSDLEKTVEELQEKLKKEAAKKIFDTRRDASAQDLSGLDGTVEELRGKLKKAAAEKKISETQKDAFRQKMNDLEETVEDLRAELKKIVTTKKSREPSKDASAQVLSVLEESVKKPQTEEGSTQPAATPDPVGHGCGLSMELRNYQLQMELGQAKKQIRQMRSGKSNAREVEDLEKKLLAMKKHCTSLEAALAESDKKPLQDVNPKHCENLEPALAESDKKPLQDVNPKHCTSLEPTLAESDKKPLLDVNQKHCTSLESTLAESDKKPLQDVNPKHCENLEPALAESDKKPLQDVNPKHCTSLEPALAESDKKPLQDVNPSQLPLHKLWTATHRPTRDLRSANKIPIPLRPFNPSGVPATTTINHPLIVKKKNSTIVPPSTTHPLASVKENSTIGQNPEKPKSGPPVSLTGGMNFKWNDAGHGSKETCTTQ
uniref:Centromere-associated protein E-like protein n=1 Tax=Halisarca dujardinii TaxID=2583056 RepID=A0AA96S2H2_HALDU|nr:centromere-associated protein E-like protein [Halisarca dujardinii]